MINQQRLIDFSREIIQVRSLSGEEQPVVAKITSEMVALGFDEILVDENGSAVGVVVGQKPGKTLLLDGHCDIVDARPSDWRLNPFAATIEDGYLYGRGAADMKGALAAMVHAAASADRSRLAGRIAVSATVVEEVMEGFSLKQVMDRIKPDAVIIGEATQFTLNRGGRGRAEIVLETIGKSAHSSSPQAGLCAVHEMMRLIQVVENAPMLSNPVVGKAQVCLTDIVSTPFPGHSVVPNCCRVSYDRRLVPGETPQSVLDGIRNLPGTQDIQYTLDILDGEEKTYTGKMLKGLKFFPAWALSEDHPLVTVAQEGLRASGFDAMLGAYAFCTNGAYSAGIAGVPTIGFGPGSETDAHTVNERMAVNDIQRAAEGYLGMIYAILS